MTGLTWQEVSEGVFRPSLDGCEVIGLDVVRQEGGKYRSFDGNLWNTLGVAQHYSIRLVEFQTLQEEPSNTVWVVSTGPYNDNEILHVASTQQKAAEWALNNGHVLAPIVERTVDDA